MELAPNPRDHTGKRKTLEKISVEDGARLSLASDSVHGGLMTEMNRRDLHAIGMLGGDLPVEGQTTGGAGRVRKIGQITEIRRRKIDKKRPREHGSAAGQYERQITIDQRDPSDPDSIVLWLADTPYRGSGKLATEQKTLQCLMPGQLDPEFPLAEILEDVTWTRDNIRAAEPANA